MIFKGQVSEIKNKGKAKSHENVIFDMNPVTARFDSLNLLLTLVGSHFKQENNFFKLLYFLCKKRTGRFCSLNKNRKVQI